jgi:hypothetical protein
LIINPPKPTRGLDALSNTTHHAIVVSTTCSR